MSVLPLYNADDVLRFEAMEQELAALGNDGNGHVLIASTTQELQAMINWRLLQLTFNPIERNQRADDALMMQMAVGARRRGGPEA
ncbi:MAG: hypothetical protein K1X47_14845 [Cyclobacteriaceae bacterium]|nr:hypothetical protein [Cyclobacteriaceae bacterium]